MLAGPAEGTDALRAAEGAITDSSAAEKELPAASVNTEAEAGGEGGAWDGTGGTAAARAGTAAATGVGAVDVIDRARIWASSFSHCRERGEGVGNSEEEVR